MSGRRATTNIIPGQYALSVGMPKDKPAPKGWRWVELNDVARMATGHTPSRRKPEYWGGEIRWMSVRDARPHHGKAILETNEHTNKLGIKNSAAVMLPVGTVCLSRTGSIGYSVILGREMATSQGFVNWICSDDLLPRFLQLIFVSENYFLHSISEGVAHTTIYFPEAKAFHICIPPYDKQKRIVAKIEELFSHIDAGIEALKKAKQLLKQYRQSVLKAAVTGELTKEWRKQNNVTLDGWQQTTIGEIALVQTGKTPKRSNPDYWEGGTIPWLTSAATNDPFTNEADQFVTRTAVNEGLKLFGSGTLLLAMYGEGKTRGQVTEITFEATCNQACAAIIVDENKASRAFVRLRLYENYEETRKAASGGNQPNLNLTKVRDITLPLPALVEQNEIVARIEQKFETVERLENDIEAQLLKIEINKQSILASAFSGSLN